MEITSLSLVPIAGIFVELSKRIGVPSKWLPLVAIFLGVGINILFKMLGETLLEQALFGIMAGAASAGLWDAGTMPLGK